VSCKLKLKAWSESSILVYNVSGQPTPGYGLMIKANSVPTGGIGLRFKVFFVPSSVEKSTVYHSYSIKPYGAVSVVAVDPLQ
jgi:hypothetical protein